MGGEGKREYKISSLYFVRVEAGLRSHLPVHVFLRSRVLVLPSNSKRIDLLDGAKALAAGGDDHGKGPRVFKTVHDGQ